jgi:hypothetical protein
MVSPFKCQLETNEGLPCVRLSHRPFFSSFFRGGGEVGGWGGGQLVTSQQRIPGNQNIYDSLNLLANGFSSTVFMYLISTLLHLLPLKFHCVRGCWEWTQDCCDFGIGTKPARIYLIHKRHSTPILRFSVEYIKRYKRHYSIVTVIQ